MVRRDDLTDVEGLRVGHHQRTGRGWRTGTTVVLCPPGTVGGVDVRGGGPGTRETDALDPRTLVHEVHAVVLTGGSAYGLAAADGVTAFLGGLGTGFPVGTDPGWVVPVVPAAVIFDLGRGGAFANRPDAGFGTRAATRAAGRSGAGPVGQGAVGAGTGAVAGGLAGGVGSASTVVEGRITVAALVVANPAGRVHDEATGTLLAAPALAAAGVRLRRPSRSDAGRLAGHLASLTPPPVDTPLNTTIGVVATDASLTKAECAKLAAVAHDGLARAVRPAHGMTDGDTFFGLATGVRDLGPEPGTPVRFGDPASRHVRLNLVLAAAADCTTRAIGVAVLAAAGYPDRPSYLSLLPSVVAPGGARR